MQLKSVTNLVPVPSLKCMESHHRVVVTGTFAAPATTPDLTLPVVNSAVSRFSVPGQARTFACQVSGVPSRGVPRRVSGLETQPRRIR